MGKDEHYCGRAKLRQKVVDRRKEKSIWFLLLYAANNKFGVAGSFGKLLTLPCEWLFLELCKFYIKFPMQMNR